LNERRKLALHIFQNKVYSGVERRRKYVSFEMSLDITNQFRIELSEKLTLFVILRLQNNRRIFNFRTFAMRRMIFFQKVQLV
jgi:hypothetical protein